MLLTAEPSVHSKVMSLMEKEMSVGPFTPGKTDNSEVSLLVYGKRRSTMLALSGSGHSTSSRTTFELCYMPL